MTAWRPMLRMARRDATRARGRSLLVLLMIALPVFAVTAADVVIQTAEISGAEALERRLGPADARVDFDGHGRVVQGVDPNSGVNASASKDPAPPTLATVSEALGRPAHGLELREGTVRVRTDKGVANAEATEIDLRDPLADGLFRLTAGRLPQEPGEVVVNAALAARGPSLAEKVDVVGEQEVTATVVGIAESMSARNYPVIVGPLDTLGLTHGENAATWLVDAGDAVSWQDVKALNADGAAVLSRAVLEDPPSASQLPDNLPTSSSDAAVAIIALIVAMALVEVVLLAGPAFAVGARRLQRTLALIASNGGTPRQLRRVVLASAVVLGGAGSALGVLAGITVAFAALPLVQRLSDGWLGPFDVPWLHVLGIAAFGLLSAVLAAVVPAALAARQDVVQVLAGRRGDRRPGLRSPVVGLVLLGAGIGGSAYGALVKSSGELYIAVSALVAVLGMILLVPVVIATAAKVSGRLPFPLRYAVRDAARHRTRTAPAVAAVAGTVVGVVALGIGASSDALENERTYVPSLPLGTGALVSWNAKPAEWPRFEQAVRRELPGNEVVPVQGIPEQAVDGSSVYLEFGVPAGGGRQINNWGSSLGSAFLVSQDSVPVGLVELDADQREVVRRTLASGGAVVITDQPVDATTVKVSATYFDENGEPDEHRPVTVPAAFVDIPGPMAPLQAVLSPQAADRLDLEPVVTGLFVDGPIPAQAETNIGEAISAVSPDAGFQVERGYQAGGETQMVLLILAALGGGLMLAGTLTATFLALSDARPDLATLSAIGATPRTRRAVAASYAGTVGLLGAILGAAVGFVPGIAVSYPLTSFGWTDIDAEGRALPDHFLDIPWLLLAAVVVVLPLLTALIVGLATRSRLPLVARVE
ncbi:ABC transporter permease [Actinopolymorpha sp. B11F2]|uniref:ABC transporter permease n=1 Tax=Actinopolymorpha sp. B11F2 TaxID=3160862 RepID=UPI0032E4BFE0